MKDFFDSDLFKWIVTLLELAAIVGVVLLIVFGLQSIGVADELTGWVICQPGDYVNVRLNPSMKAGVVGRLELGDEIHPDGQMRNGFLHCTRIGMEVSEAWVYAGYVVYEKPVVMNKTVTVNRNRVAARKCIGGKRRCWLKKGQRVKVYYIGGDWAVTDHGFVMSEYLEVGQ